MLISILICSYCINQGSLKKQLRRGTPIRTTRSEKASHIKSEYTKSPSILFRYSCSASENLPNYHETKRGISRHLYLLEQYCSVDLCLSYDKDNKVFLGHVVILNEFEYYCIFVRPFSELHSNSRLLL